MNRDCEMFNHKNYTYRIDNDVVIITLKTRNGNCVDFFIDVDNLEDVLSFDYKWNLFYHKNTKTYYVRTSMYIGIINGKPKAKSILLHRFIMRDFINELTHVDHKNNNTLDNRKSNLRLTNNRNNLKNRASKNSNNKSGYRNVSWLNCYKKWCVQLQLDGKNTLLGKFDDVHEAGKFAEEMRQKYYGEFKGNN